MDDEEKARLYAKAMMEYVESIDRSDPLCVAAAIDGFETGVVGGTYINVQTSFGLLPDAALLAKAKGYCAGRKLYVPGEGDED